jgi:uncharacterized protein involved in exopolysaccharide biosynthesis
MNTEKSQVINFDSISFIAFLYQKRKIILSVTIAAAIVSTIVSLLIPNKYKSTVIMFPTTTGSIAKALIAEQRTGKDDILQLGEEEQAEQMLQILYSDKITNAIIEKFDLMNHYKIDTTSKYKYTELKKEYENNISFKRTEYMSVRIDVLDTDPQMAADIANEIANLYDQIKNEMLRERSKQAFEIVSKEYNNFLEFIKLQEDSLAKIMSYGVFDYESQSEMLMEQYAIALAKNDMAAAKRIEEKLDILAKYGVAYVSLREKLDNERKNLAVLKAKYDEAKIDAEQNMTHKFVVNYATPAEKKSYPVRWLIVTVSTVASFLLCIFIIVVLEQFQRVKLELNK